MAEVHFRSIDLGCLSPNINLEKVTNSVRLSKKRMIGIRESTNLDHLSIYAACNTFEHLFKKP